MGDSAKRNEWRMSNNNPLDAPTRTPRGEEMNIDIAGFAFIVGVIFLIVIFYGDPDLHDIYIQKLKVETKYIPESQAKED